MGTFAKSVYRLRINLRKRAEDVENETERENILTSADGVKKVANSLYGKLCEKTHTNQCQYVYDKFIKKRSEDIKYHSMLSGAYVSWYSRLTVYGKILKVLQKG